jgi:hypothetical protein
MTNYIYKTQIIDTPNESVDAIGGINNAGIVVGTSAGVGGGAFIYNGAFTILPIPSSFDPFFSQANGIDTAQTIVGNTIQGFYESGGVYNAISVPSGVNTIPKGINAAGGIVVGTYTIDNTDVHIDHTPLDGQPAGFVWFSRTNQFIDPFNLAFCNLTGVNDLEEIVGFGPAGDGHTDGLIFASADTTSVGDLQQFDVPGALDTFLTGINNEGVIVGHASFPSGVTRSCVWDNHGPGTISFLPTPLLATAINDSGQVAGTLGTGQFFIDTLEKPQATDDFSADGTSDVLLQSGGAVINWLISNGAYSGYNALGNTSGYRIVGAGDFNDDAATDILLENGSGILIDWILQHGQYASYNTIGNTSGYGVVGTGDYNADGTNDVLLENGSGNIIDWTIKNGTYSGSNEVGTPGSYGVVGKGDFNGDGTSDVLLENGSGNLIDWIMKNGVYSSYNGIGNASGYGIVGTGDFNGDGTSDLLLENGSGNVIDWILQNGNYSSWNEIGGTSGYGVVSTGDYNGDGTSDILLENAGQSVIDWTIQNGTFSGWHGVGNASGYGVSQ